MIESFKPNLLNKINSELSLDPEVPVEGETDLVLTGLVDSLGVMEIVAWMEETLDVPIDPADIVLENFQTVDAMVAFAGTLSVDAS